MHELRDIIEQRKQAIRLIQTHASPSLKSHYIEDERKRHERQNWILRVLKNIKIQTPDQKKIIYQTTLQIMRPHHALPNHQPNFQSDNYIETMINLFVEFYNALGNVDTTHIRTIIRPNNNYIIVDLIKTLLELSREEFRQVVHQQFQQITRIRSTKKQSVSKVEFPPTLKQQTETTELPKPKPASKPQLPITTKIELALFQKYTKTAQTLPYDHLSSQINDLYLTLMDHNSKNHTIIQHYLDSCFGPRRLINYNYSALYTQQEIQQILTQKKINTQKKITDIQPLQGDCTQEQLKQFFKIKIQNYEHDHNLPLFQPPTPLRQWLPLTLIKNGQKQTPFSLMVIHNACLYAISEFEQRHNKKIRSHIKEQLLQHYSHIDAKLAHDPQYLLFNRKDYIDYNCHKFIELLQRQAMANSAKPKNREGQLPAINQQDQQSRRNNNKSQSEHVLRSASLVIPPLPQSKHITYKLNSSSLIDNQQNSSRNRVSLLIDKFLSTKQYSVN